MELHVLEWTWLRNECVCRWFGNALGNLECWNVFQLVLSWHMKAGTMCEFSKKEFIEGLQSLGYEIFLILLWFFFFWSHFSQLKTLKICCRIDSLEKFQEKIPYMRSELKDERTGNSILITAKLVLVFICH